MKIRQGMRNSTRSMRAYETRNRGIGLGDLVWLFTTLTGIRFLLEWWQNLRGKSCGCRSRRERWNGIRIMSPIGFGFMTTIMGLSARKTRTPDNVEGAKTKPIPPEALFGPEYFEEVP